MEQPKKTIEQLKKMKNPLEKSMKIMEINENHGELDKNETNSETSGKVDEQCEWEILATKCSNWKILAAKTKESLDDKNIKIKMST